MKKTRILSLFTALVLLLGTVSAVPAGAEDAAAPKRTLMVYAVGSNLEEESRLFTNKMIEFSESPYNENLDVILITGGSLEWHTPAEYLDGASEVDVEYDQVWKLVGKKEGEEHGVFKVLEPTGMPGSEKADMGTPGTLTAFLDYCYENYPADIYDMILWDHGGGPVDGYGYDDRFGSMIRLPGLVSAFGDSKLVGDGKKFDLIDFDACIMANVTVITALGNFADYVVLSSEVEYEPAQRHMRLLETLCGDPSIGGYEMGKILVDEFVDYFNEDGYPATLCVVDTKNYRERLLPLICELDGILISEAKDTGEKNNRYNFYDELYSLTYSCAFADGAYSLYDLGNLVGALSVPMSEMDNISAAQRSSFENAYTDLAKRILAVLSDEDQSGDDVLYFRCSDTAHKTVGAGVVRGADGELVYADGDGKTVVTPTGLSILFADRNLYNAVYYADGVKLLLDGDFTEEEKAFFKARLTTLAYYSIIYEMGISVSCLKSEGMKYVSYRAVKEDLCSYGWWDFLFVPMTELLVEFGEFADLNEAEDYMATVVAQQNSEALSTGKVVVRPIENADGSFDSYQLTVNNSSAQNLMSVDEVKKVTVAGNDDPVFLGYFKFVYGTEDLNEIYPDGLCFDIVTSASELDAAPYYRGANDTLAELYERIYSSATSVWNVPKMTEGTLVMYDGEGKAHLTDVRYTDESREYAYMPINMCDTGKDAYYYFTLILRKTDGVWSLYGISGNKEDLLSFVESPYGEFFDGLMMSPGTIATDPVFGFTATVPISTFTPVDVSKDNWGLSFAEAKVAELDDVASFESSYTISDVYGRHLNVNEFFEKADEAAERGEFVRSMALADITVGDFTHTGGEARPEVCVRDGEKTLEEGVDYKAIFDGSTEVGDAYVYIFGLGDYTGTAVAGYKIVSEKPDPIPGDVNGDGKVNAKDVVWIMRYLVGRENENFNAALADFDADGKVNAKDVVAVMRSLVS